MQIEVQIVSAFTALNKGGNPAGVVLDADKLTAEDKLEIAKQVGLSETAFVSGSTEADFKLDFFTPTRQIAHCGHATIATFGLLHQKGLLEDNTESSKETIDGKRKVFMQNGMPFMEQLAPKLQSVEEHLPKILSSLSIEESVLIDMPQVINTGNSFLVLGVNTEQDLINLKSNFELIEQVSETFDLIGYYVFSLQTKDSNNDAAARMFAPRYGIQEEAATGMAAGPLASYLYNQLDFKKLNFIIEQGYLMETPSPSLIEVNLNIVNNKIDSLLAGGKAMIMNSLIIDY